MLRLYLRTTRFTGNLTLLIVKETLVSLINTYRYILDRLTRQLFPMRFPPTLQLRYMLQHTT